MDNNKCEVSDEVIRSIMDYSELHRFSAIYFGEHVSLFQDMSAFETPNLSVNRYCEDAHSWAIHLTVFFWSLNVSWNGRKETWSFSGKALYTLIGIGLIAVLIVGMVEAIHYLDRGEVSIPERSLVFFSLIMATFVSISNKLRKMLKNL